MTGKITTRIAAVLAAAITITGAGVSAASASTSRLPVRTEAADVRFTVRSRLR